MRCSKHVHTRHNVEATFDFVVKNGNNVKRVFREISSFRQRRNKLNMFNVQFVSTLSKESFDLSILQCRCFDTVAGVDRQLAYGTARPSGTCSRCASRSAVTPLYSPSHHGKYFRIHGRTIGLIFTAVSLRTASTVLTTLLLTSVDDITVF